VKAATGAQGTGEAARRKVAPREDGCVTSARKCCFIMMAADDLKAEGRRQNEERRRRKAEGKMKNEE